MWTFVVTIQRDRLDWKWNRFSFAQKEFEWHSNREVLEQILERVEDEEDDGNVIVDIMNITQVM